MNRISLLLPLLVAARSERPADANGQAGTPNDQPAVTVAAPAGAPSGDFEQILGAIDGPCGSPRAQDYLGRSWTEGTSAAMKEKTGAAEVKLFRFNDVADSDGKMNERRLNVYLSPSGRIVHLVCG
ncbi:MAG TPA: I78 family peptidase inhibitor [Allosphingosinicella sp.]|nr:I78 family peptidase inhibitor [Allosphingosinicella sp.]